MFTYSRITSTLALIVALSGTAYAATLGKNTVGPKQIKAGAVRSAEIKADAVTATDVELPAPTTAETEAGGGASVGTDYAKIADLAAFTKEGADSVVQVDWSGPVRTEFSSCVFQLRVDGAAPGSAGEAFVGNGTTTSVATQASFAGLAPGAHMVEVWARATSGGGYPCALAPQAGVGQSVLIAETAV